MLRGEPVDAVSREVGVTIAELEQWRELALAGLEAGLKTRTSDPLQARLDEAVRRVGELSMDPDVHFLLEVAAESAGRQDRAPEIT